MIKVKNFNKFIILAIVLIVFYIILVFAIFSQLFLKKSLIGNTVRDIPTPTKTEVKTNLNKAPFYTNSMDILPEDKTRLQKEGSIGSLIKNLPYNRKYFSLSYNYEDDSFTLYTYLNNLEETDAQLEAFLKINGIADKSLLQNLNIIYITPTPEL